MEQPIVYDVKLFGGGYTTLGVCFFVICSYLLKMSNIVECVI